MSSKIPLNNRLIVALDTDSPQCALDLVERLRERVSIFKVGLQLFLAGGTDIIATLKRNGINIFLDLKFHDIPATVAKASIEAVKLGVDMFTLHASGGLNMMKASLEACDSFCQKGSKLMPQILAVTALTSHDEMILHKELDIHLPLDQYSLHMTKLALTAGLHGAIISVGEVSLLRHQVPAGFLLITPGIRSSGESIHDQRRVATPQEAIRLGADYLVVGRPILEASDPIQAADKILEDIRRSGLPESRHINPSSNPEY